MDTLNNIRISRRAFPFIILQVLLLALQCSVLSNIGSFSFADECDLILAFVVADVALQVAGLIVIDRLVSIGGLFLLATYLVNLSYVVLLAFDAQGATSALSLIYLSRYGQRTFLLASVYALNVACFLFLGYLLFSIFRFRRDSPEVSTDRAVPSQLYRPIGLFASVVFGAVYIVSTAYQLVYVFAQGSYVDWALNVSHSSFMSNVLTLEPFFFAGLYLLMAYYKTEGRIDVSRKILLFAVFCIVLSFLTGSRSRGVMLLLVLLTLWIKTIERISPKTLFVYLVCGLFLFQLMYAVRSVRGYDLSLLGYIQAFFSSENSLLYETLNEFGATICATAGLMNAAPQAHPLDFFIKEIGSILPGISSWGGDAFLAPTVRTGIEQRYHMGSSFVGDLYFYFKSAGQPMAVLYGFWIAFLDGFVESRGSRGAFWPIAVAFPGLYAVFNSVRAPISLGLKMFLYSFIIFGILAILIRSRTGGRSAEIDLRASQPPSPEGALEPHVY